MDELGHEGQKITRGRAGGGDDHETLPEARSGASTASPNDPGDLMLCKTNSHSSCTPGLAHLGSIRTPPRLFDDVHEDFVLRESNGEFIC